jgi:nucleotide-binding universal stress UspA family protein
MSETARSEYDVVVAVGPEGIHDGVLDLAVAEAERRQTGVELLHVVHSLVSVPVGVDAVQSLDAALTEVGRMVLTSAADRVRSRSGGRVPHTTHLLFGRVATTIADRVPPDGIVFLERHDSADRLLTMSVSTRVAAHAHAAVVVVPAAWRRGPYEPRPVTVGVDDPDQALGQVETALAFARDTGRPLVVVHAAWLAEPYQDLVFGNTTRDEWVHDAEQRLDLALTKLPEHDGVAVSTAVDWRRPADALVGASLVSAFVVLSRRRERAIGPHLGAVTRTVLRHAAGPVMVVDRT